MLQKGGGRFKVLQEFNKGEEENMSKNNPVGTIPVEIPILTRMRDTIMNIYIELSKEEEKSLQTEIESVTESNCDWVIYDIAQILKDYIEISALP